MKLETIFFYTVVTIASGCAVIKFALYELDDVLRVWRRFSATHKGRKASEPRAEVVASPTYPRSRPSC